MSASTACPPTKASSITISWPLSPSNTSPSTGKSSVFSFADSVLSSSPGTPPLPTRTRKHGKESEQVEAGSRQKRTTGRPRNAWTSSRSRKAVRLYLMTDLSVEKIATTLEVEGFRPQKRDVIKQLALLLQPRPNKLRGGPNIAKARHNLMRDCRALRKARKPTQCTHTRQQARDKLSVEDNKGLEEWAQSSWTPLCKPGPSWTWEDSDRTSASMGLVGSSDPLAAYHSRFPFKEIQYVDPKDVHQIDTQIRGRDSILYDATSLLNKFPTVPSGQRSDQNVRKFLPTVLVGSPGWILPYSRVRHIDAQVSLLHPAIQPMPFPSLRQSLEIPQLIIDSCNTEPSKLESTIPMDHLALPPGGHSTLTNMSARREDGSHLFPGGTSSGSSRSSLMTVKDVRSSYDDILSLMERHTISGSSATLSSTRTSQMSKSSRHLSIQSDLTITASTMNYPLTLSTETCPSVVLPGAFNHFCWAQIDQNSLGLCRQDGLLCEHVTLSANPFFASQFGSQGILYNRIEFRGITDVDSFGNSILHVAASIGAPVKYLISLIRQLTNINAKNNGGETFLHLIRAPMEEDDICALLEELSAHHFDFTQRDDHGQTSIHILTRPWHPHKYLVKVIKKLTLLGWHLASSRDSLGYSLIEQMGHPFSEVSFADEEEDCLKSLDLQNELPSFTLQQPIDLTCNIPGPMCRPSVPENWVRPVSQINYSAKHPNNQALAHTILGPQRLEQHADLLKTVNAASHMYWFEDSGGRNGLHCLAEVAFYPHAIGSIEERTQHLHMEEVEDSGNMREDSLDSLLAVGVDPNNYDKNGNTPVMAFIIHTHPAEDDNTIARILQKLVNAKADIHRRNRQGETALHLAVKLGRRAATKFLLENGANVHARNKNGEGVLEIGHKTLKACRSLNSDVSIYAQILLCMCLAQVSGAIPQPTILKEWSSSTIVNCCRRKPSTSLSASHNKRVKKQVSNWI